MRGSPKFIPSPSWSSKFLVHVHENHANPATLPQPFYHTHFYTHHLSLTNLHVSFMHATPLSSNTNCHLSTLYPLCISIIPIITHYTHQTILLSSFLTLDFLHTHKPISPFIQHSLSLYTTAILVLSNHFLLLSLTTYSSFVRLSSPLLITLFIL